MKKYSLIYMILGFGLLLLFSQKILLPLVYDVIKSDALLTDTQDQASQFPISNELTDLAFLHCNNHIKTELGQDKTVTFSDKPVKAWTLGNYHFLINGEMSISGSNTPSNTKYVCRIAYDNGDNKEGAQDFKNWTIEGIDGVDGL